MKVYMFKYGKGSHPGSTRTVLVTEDNGGIVSGLDFGLNSGEDYRRFAKANMSNLQVIDAIEVLSPSNTSHLASVVHIYEQDGYDVKVHNDKLYLVKLKPKDKINIYVQWDGKFVVSVNNISLSLNRDGSGFSNSKGEYLSIKEGLEHLIKSCN